MNSIITICKSLIVKQQNSRDSSDFQISYPNSPKVVCVSPKYKSFSQNEQMKVINQGQGNEIRSDGKVKVRGPFTKKQKKETQLGILSRETQEDQSPKKQINIFDVQVEEDDTCQRNIKISLNQTAQRRRQQVSSNSISPFDQVNNQNYQNPKILETIDEDISLDPLTQLTSINQCLSHIEQQDYDDHFQKSKISSTQQISNLQVESISMLILQNVIEECAQEFVQQPKVQSFLQNQIYNTIFNESDLTLGIQTNLGVINEFIINFSQYIIGKIKHFNIFLEKQLNNFIMKMNYPFGLLPLTRLRQLHGYEIKEASFDSTNNSDIGAVFNRTFTLEESWFTEFENQNVIYYFNKTQNDPKQDQIIRKYESYHNRAIFDSFNEILNVFRPFYLVNGMPYPWSISEKHLTVIIINDQNIGILFEKVKQKIIEYSSSLCGNKLLIKFQGLIQEDEQIFGYQDLQTPHISIKDANDGYIDPSEQKANGLIKEVQELAVDERVRPNYMQAIMAIQKQDTDYVGQIREERLQKVLLAELSEYEFQWYLQEDEKAEVLLEITDYIFEDLIEDMLKQLF